MDDKFLNRFFSRVANARRVYSTYYESLRIFVRLYVFYIHFNGLATKECGLTKSPFASVPYPTLHVFFFLSFYRFLIFAISFPGKSTLTDKIAYKLFRTSVTRH